MNLQMAVKDERIWVLEANPRASRTVPFVSKVIGVSLARVATLVLTGRTIADLRADGVLPSDPFHYRHLPYTSVKAAVLPFGRFPGVDTVLGPEMKSTGEVMGIDADSGMALAKAMVAAGHALPTGARCSSASPTATSGRSCSPRSDSPTSASVSWRRAGRRASWSAPGSPWHGWPR
jgi:carbamoyl-phosphate synthase large subunit